MKKRVSCILLLSLLTFACTTKGEAPPSSESKSTPKQAATKAQSPKQPQAAAGEETAPARFTVKLETTKGDILVDDVRSKLELVPTIGKVNVELTFEPPWNHSMMSEVARLETGMF